MPQAGMVFVGARNVVLSARDQPSLPPGEYVRVSITDKGGGIAENVLPKIFDPYFSTKQRGQQKGMGLGLTICHAVVQKHGGAIAVESEFGAGTTFHVFLRAARKVSGGEQAATPAGEKIPAAADLARPARVLVMDDEEGVRKVVRLTLQGLGHAVELAQAGQQAVEVYQAAAILGRPFDVVILDLTVRAGMGGQETMQALRQLDPAVKVVAMSGYAQDPVILEPERHGFIAALAKPFDVSKLRDVLARIMTTEH
jgi:CheY-like chemotaxis protein